MNKTSVHVIITGDTDDIRDIKELLPPTETAAIPTRYDLGDTYGRKLEFDACTKGLLVLLDNARRAEEFSEEVYSRTKVF